MSHTKVSAQLKYALIIYKFRTTLDIENFFAILKDGEWHDIPELAFQIEIPAGKLTEFSQFLSKQGIIKFGYKTQRIKIEPEWKELIPEEKEPATEPKNTVATSSSRQKQQSTFNLCLS